MKEADKKHRKTESKFQVGRKKKVGGKVVKQKEERKEGRKEERENEREGKDIKNGRGWKEDTQKVGRQELKREPRERHLFDGATIKWVISSHKGGNIKNALYVRFHSKANSADYTC